MSWEKAKLGNIIKIQKGKAITKKDSKEGPYPVILGGREPAYYIDQYNHTGKAIVVSRSGASAGYISFWNEAIFVTDGFLVEPRENIDIDYLYYLMKSHESELMGLQGGAAIPHVTPKIIGEINVCIPDISMQRKISDILLKYDDSIKNNRKQYLLDSIGYEATYCFIKNNAFDKKDVWMSFIWESVPEENINEKVVNDYKTFVFDNLEKDNPIIPTVQVVARYCERDSEIKEAVIKAVLDKPKLSAQFLGDTYDDGIKEIINFFKNDISALTSIYMSAIKISCEVDYDGKLFAKIFEQQHAIWHEYMDWVKSKDNMSGDRNEHKIFELIWRDDKWCEHVEYAFKILIDDDASFYINESASLLFAKTTDTAILERKKDYLFEKLRESNSEIEKCKKLMDVVVNILPEWKLEYILEFLKVNKKLNDFKKIDLFPWFCSWSGSEIPLIMEKIDFLKLLKDNLKGIDYIDHRKYIEEYRMNLEKYKEKIKLREYIENTDYA